MILLFRRGVILGGENFGDRARFAVQMPQQKAAAFCGVGVLGFALGVVAGVKRGTWIDKAVKAYCFVLAATPTFWLGLLALMVFAVALGWFPIGFSAPIGKPAADVTVWDALRHLALPALTLSVVGVANIALHTREKAIDVLRGIGLNAGQTACLTEFSKGLVFRNF
mgnify:CR=1 FL=1